MGKLDNLNIGDNSLYQTNLYSGNFNQDMYLKRAKDDTTSLPKFYLSIYANINGTLVLQGYLYFYLDFINHISYFIGIKVKEQYRNLNIASLLVATWIDLCLNNGFDFLGTNKKQRKPFLLYLLKTYGFEIMDTSLYETRDDIITICRSLDQYDKSKILYFDNPNHALKFQKTNVFKTDNYVIVPSREGVVILDKVIIPIQSIKRDAVSYDLQDFNLAQEKSITTINKHKK